jgi:hypothetical protein
VFVRITAQIGVVKGVHVGQLLHHVDLLLLLLLSIRRLGHLIVDLSVVVVVVEHHHHCVKIVFGKVNGIC